MVIAVVIVIAYLLVAAYELVAIISKEQVKWFFLYSIFMAASMVLSVLLYLGVPVPSPAKPITAAVEAIHTLLKGVK